MRNESPARGRGLLATTNRNPAVHAQRITPLCESPVADERQFPMLSDYRKNHTYRVGIADALSTEIDMAIKGKLKLSIVGSCLFVGSSAFPACREPRFDIR
jgi:hypothetical protein